MTLPTYRSVPHINHDKWSCRQKERFHIQSVNWIDRSTLVYICIYISIEPTGPTGFLGKWAPPLWDAEATCPGTDLSSQLSYLSNTKSYCRSKKSFSNCLNHIFKANNWISWKIMLPNENQSKKIISLLGNKWYFRMKIYFETNNSFSLNKS